MTEPFKSNPCPGANNTMHANTAELSEQSEQKDKATGLPDFDTMTRKEIRHMFYEMQAKQIEAEHHNKKLLCQLEESPDNATLFGIVTENMLEMVALTDMEGTFIFAGKAHEILGYEPDSLIGKNVMDFVHPEDLPHIMEEFAEFVASGNSRKIECRYRCEDGTYLWLEIWGNFITDVNGIPQKIIFSSRDIAERKRAETYREMGLEILQILNEPGDLQESIQRVLATLKTRTGVDAVGLRLKEGEDFPYFVRDGFPKDFLLTENTLLERVKDGGVCRHKDGKVRLECTCGLVISGKTDPSDPLFTRGGSSWTNDSIPLLDLPFDQDLRIHPRNNCIHQGYASVALIPVRTSDQIVGLVQLNDKRKDRFTLEMIEVLEGIAAHIGSALMRKRAEQALAESETRFKALHNASFGGIAIHDQGIILECNQGLPEMTGYQYSELIGMDGLLLIAERSREAVINNILTGYEKPYEAFGLRKNGEEFPIQLEARNVPYKGKQVRTVEFRDITERKRAEEKLRYRLIYEQMLSRISTMAAQYEDLELFIDDSLIIIGETLDVSRVYLFEHHHETDSMDNTFEWCSLEESPQKDNLQGLPSAAVPWWMATLKEGGTICFSDVEDIPDEGAKEFLRPQGICSTLSVPLFVAGRYHGFIGFDECRFHREWPEEDVEILLAISRIIAGAVYKKKSEEEIKRERQQLLSIFNSIEENIYISDPETYEILYVNPKLAHILQRDCVGSICYKEFQEIDEPCTFCTNDIILKHKPLSHSWEYYNPKLEMHFSIVNRIIEWPDGRNVRFEMAIDITERKQAEVALLSQKAHFESLFINTSDAMVFFDTEHCIVNINNMFTKIFGYTLDEVRGKNINIVMDPHNQAHEYGSPLILQGKQCEMEDVRYTKSGEPKDVLLKGGPVCEQGEIVGGYAIYADITEKKQAEKEKEKLQSQLNQAQKMESVGRLAGGVAHDFNNKLTIINGYAEMTIDMMDPSDPLRETIQEIHTAGKQSAVIVRQLLAFARKQEISPVKLDLNDTISGLLKMLQRLISENIDLAWHPGRNLWSVKIDPSQLDQIIANLAVNARDAIEDVGKITIESTNIEADEDYCALYPYVVPGQYVMLTISDNGSGMDKETLGNLFEPFFTTKDVGKGTGLGLATVYGIVKQNKGCINVYSEPGMGTTFKIYLPRHETEKTSVKPEMEFKRQVPKGTETILIVEDEKGVLQMSRRILDRLGYTVLIAENPREALQQAKKYNETIHLLITDVVMPEMNGCDMASQMTMIRPGLKTLYMSGYTANAIAHNGEIDMDMLFIQKPFSMQDFADKVREAIE